MTSKKDVGTTVIVTLPHRIAEKSNLVMLTGVEYDAKRFQGKCILLAEDNDLNAEIAIEILKEAGFVIERAEDGQICVEISELDHPHIWWCRRNGLMTVTVDTIFYAHFQQNPFAFDYIYSAYTAEKAYLSKPSALDKRPVFYDF